MINQIEKLIDKERSGREEATMVHLNEEDNLRRQQ